ncbi:MAG: MBL fold metallo-hydrolase [Pseudobdellovibrionaceae bacterium]|nr:MBL fold metallo-hydrolase [Bdellovibrionales bacterium]USN47940.1 MAG: MBL fold metallo-hydrolase [Pseudobdellovibrionaceae bacterium]
MQIEFLGAAQTVTGSRTLLHHGDKKILVDCGLYQGSRELRDRNWAEFTEAPDIDFVVLTHAHVDHSGYLPKLVSEGFKGPVYCSQSTAELCKIMLRDSAHLQEEDARFANKKGYSRHQPALPLYTSEDAEAALRLFRPVPMDTWVELTEGLSFRLLRAGHILGACIVQFSMSEENGVRTLTFSGDLGHGRQNVIKGPVAVDQTDYLVLESTYGDRLHPREDVMGIVKEQVHYVKEQGGVLVIPAFTVGRTQEVLYMLKVLEERGEIPNLEVYVDSPMATAVTDLYMRHKDELRLSFENGQLQYPLEPSSYIPVRSVDESMLLCMRNGPMIVISAAGMLTGGRILHHLKKRLPSRKNVVLFVGYQAEDTKGRLLQSGLPTLRIHHEPVEVRAKIVTIESLSAHADTNDLMDWLRQFSHPPKKVFLNHGEPQSIKALCYRIRHELGWDVVVPSYGDKFELGTRS